MPWSCFPQFFSLTTRKFELSLCRSCITSYPKFKALSCHSPEETEVPTRLEKENEGKKGFRSDYIFSITSLCGENGMLHMPQLMDSTAHMTWPPLLQLLSCDVGDPAKTRMGWANPGLVAGACQFSIHDRCDGLALDRAWLNRPSARRLSSQLTSGTWDQQSVDDSGLVNSLSCWTTHFPFRKAPTAWQLTTNLSQKHVEV